MPFSDDVLARSRQRLESELVEIEKELAELGAEADGSIQVSLDEGFADAAQATSERAKVLSFVEGLIKHLHDVQSALEHAAQRLPVFAFARPGEHGGVERLVECAKRGERPERAPRIGGQRYAGQQGENAAAGWRRAGCVQSVPPCGTVRMLSGEHTSKALVRPSGAHDG